MLKRFMARLVLVCLVLALSAAAQEEKNEKVDLDAINKIRYEGFHNSKIMEIASGLMDGIGPRLTGSPNMKRANEWTRDKLTEFGLSNAHLEPWSPFGRGWSNEYINVRMISPDVAPIIAYAKAWTPGTSGEVRGSVVHIKITSPQDYARYKGKLAGKIVFFGDPAEVKLSTEPLSQRYNDKTLDEVSRIRFPAKETMRASVSFCSGRVTCGPSPNFSKMRKCWPSSTTAAVPSLAVRCSCSRVVLTKPVRHPTSLRFPSPANSGTGLPAWWTTMWTCRWS